MTETTHTEDLKQRTNDFVHALAASDADVANIGGERTEQGIRVTFDLLNADHIDLARDVADDYGFEQYGDTGERFETGASLLFDAGSTESDQ